MDEKGVILKLHIAAKSYRFELGEFDGLQNELRVKVCSPPHKGKANKELLKELKKAFSANVDILKGEKSNKKIVLVHASKEKVLAVLKPTEKP